METSKASRMCREVRLVTHPALSRLIEQWRAEHKRINSFHATMGTGWAVCADELESALRLSTAEQDRLSEASELKRWRDWAQFVYLGGGPVTLPDAELRAAVCASHDARVDEVRQGTASPATQKPTT